MADFKKYNIIETYSNQKLQDVSKKIYKHLLFNNSKGHYLKFKHFQYNNKGKKDGNLTTVKI